MDNEDPIKLLCKLIDEAGLRMTFDAGRGHSLPCYCCGKKEGFKELIDIGNYLNEHHDKYTRPFCDECLSSINAVVAQG
jgi:hypothetical protein